MKSFTRVGLLFLTTMIPTAGDGTEVDRSGDLPLDKRKGLHGELTVVNPYIQDRAESPKAMYRVGGKHIEREF